MSTRVQDQHLRLRPSVHFAPVEDGVYFKNWERSVLVKGHRALYPLCERLIPALEVGVAREALLAATPGPAREVVAALLARLEQNGMLLVDRPPDPGSRAAEDRRRFASALAFLESVADDPGAAFARVRAARVLLIGQGHAQHAAARALASMAVGRLVCVTGPEDQARLAALLAGIDGVDAEVTTDEHACAGPFDLVVRLERTPADHPPSTDHAAPLLRVLVGADLALVGPIAGPGGGPSLTDALARLRVELRPHTSPVGSRVLDGFVGNQAAYEAFKQLAGVPSGTQAGQCAVVHRDPLDATFHAVEPLDIDTPEPPVPLERGVWLAQLGPLFDPIFGALDEPHPRALPQLPLFVQAAGPDRGRPVLGFGETVDDARERAVLEGVRALAGRVHGAPGLDPEAPTWFDLAVGRSTSEALADGLWQCAEHLLSATELGRTARRRLVSVDEAEDAEVARLWHTLSRRVGVAATVEHVQLPGVDGLHLAEVVGEGTRLGVGVGPTRAAALRGALRVALGHAQLGAAGVDPLTVRILRGSGAERLTGAPSITPILEALARMGVRVSSWAWHGDAMFARRGLFLRWVGYVAR